MQHGNATTAGEPQPTPAPAAAPAHLLGFLRRLIDCYRRVQSSPEPRLDRNVAQERLVSLQLAEAAIRLHRGSAADLPARPPQVAVLGPTQAGKSTIVNALVGHAVAEVSPLAGFTVHAQGLWLADEMRDPAWVAALFPGWERVEADALRRDATNEYALELIDPPGVEPRMPACVVWDTPDFDSLRAHEYERGVLEVAALADAVLLVLSKDKYSDLSVWRMLKLIEPLGRPLVIALNKLTPEAEDAVTRSLRQRLAEFGSAWGFVPVVAVPFVERGEARAQLDDVGSELRRQIALAIARGPQAPGVSSASAAPPVARLLRAHWSSWLEPVVREQQGLDAWNHLIDQALETAVESYGRDYLDHPQRFDSFRRATVELLNLLEIPGFGGPLAKARLVLTWPARKLVGLGREMWQQRRVAGGRRRSTGSEEAVLNDIVDALLVSLERDAARKAAIPSESPVWSAIHRGLDERESQLRAAFQQASARHRELVQREIHQAASQLYAALRERPAVLNTLRGARATADVAAIALAIKTGGLHPNDLIFAPAIFAVTSMLTEGALGGYMTGVAESLKARQHANLRKTLVDGVFARELRSLTDKLEDDALFGVSGAQRAAAEGALRRWEGGGE